MPSVSEVRDQMNKAYAAGTAYKTALPFDLMRGIEIRQATKTLARAACAAVGAPSDTPTLDVGSGEGGIATFWDHTNIVGIEISEEAVKTAKKSNPAVTYHCAAVEEFQLLPGMQPFRLVVAQESIEHWTNAELGLRNLHAAMAENSALVITTPNRDSLHCRMSRKLGLGEAPYCSHDHVHEFGFQELLGLAKTCGFSPLESAGVGLLPYWAMERVFGRRIRDVTDNDEEVNIWMNEIGRSCPEYAFIQCHAFERLS